MPIFLYFCILENKSSRNDEEQDHYKEILLPPAFPWKCWKNLRPRGPRHYYLRKKIAKRKRNRPNDEVLKTPVIKKRKHKKAKKVKDNEPFKQPPHWTNYTEEQQMEDYANLKHRLIHQSFMMFEMQYGISLDDFAALFDPITHYRMQKDLQNPEFLTSNNEKTRRQEKEGTARIAAFELQQKLTETAFGKANRWTFPRDPVRQAVRKTSVYFTPTREQCPIVLDTGASISLTPYRDDFVGDIEKCPTQKLTGLTDSTPILGQGKVAWTIVDVFGVIRTIRATAYYVPDATIRLFSPQTYFQEHDAGSCIIEARRTSLTLADGSTLEFPYQANNNLPMMLPAEPLNVGLTYEDCQFLGSNTTLQSHLSVADEVNQNLTTSQRELALWHWRLCHAHWKWVQKLFARRRPTREDPDEETSPILEAKAPKVSSCPNPLCAACQLGKQARRTPNQGVTQGQRPQMAIRREDLDPGVKVSCDQYISAMPGRLPDTYGKENAQQKYRGGTIFYDHASGVIFLRHQVSLRAGETVRAKRAFEQFAKQHGVNIKSYRADNLPFNSQEFKDDLALHEQTIDFSGVGAHHQNGVAERSIQTVTTWARTMLLHASIHWPDAADLDLWPFALEHAVHIWNHLPKRDNLLSPLEIFSGTKVDNYDRLQRAHVWGCPVYVLDPKLQDEKKIPKFNPCSRWGQYLGQSTAHSSTIGRILNLRTGWVSPQYHVVYDDLFTTVPNAESGGLLELSQFNPTSWNRLIEIGLERHIDDVEYDRRGRRLLPQLHDDWLTDFERRLRNETRATRQRRRQAPADTPRTRRQQHPPALNPEGADVQAPPQVNPPPVQPPPEQEQSSDDESEFNAADAPGNEDDDALSLPEGVSDEQEQGNETPPEPLPEQQQTRMKTRSGREVKPSRRVFGDEWANYKGFYSGRKKVRLETINNQFLAMLQWTKTMNMLDSYEFQRMWSLIQDETDPETNTVEWMHPMILAAKANSEDNPTWDEAMSGPLKEGYWEAALKEMDILQVKQAWDVVQREDYMNVLPGTWAFKCKRFPDGAVRKLKARFCVRGDRQKKEVDYFETFAPVVNWNTVRLMLILSQVMGLATKQVDYTAAFVHAPIKEDVYVEMPRGFAEHGQVLKLKRSLYGLKQSPRNFFLFLKSKLEAAGFRNQEEIDPCLFMSDKCICLVYVDDTLFYAPKAEFIEKAIAKLKELGMELEVEDSVAGFLGVHIERDERDQSIKLTQLGLTRRIVEALQISHHPIKHTPAGHEPLTKDISGDPPDAIYNYSSVVGMLQYLQGHSRPDITYAVSQVARFVHSPRRSHEIALERIGQYLRGTINEGLILRPTGRFDMDCYVDADFAGLWPYEDKMDPVCVKSRTGFVICISDCPVVWASKLQPDIALSTMESEYTALSTAMKDVIPVRMLFTILGSSIGIDDNLLTVFKTTVHEDNFGALTLARMEPGRTTPRSKHYAVKIHWFRSKLIPNRIVVSKIDTSLQRADILTKGLRIKQFQSIRQLLCGW